MSEPIKYDFAGLDTLSGDLNRHFGALGELSDQLKSEVTKLSGNWTSPEGAEGYRVAQAHWDKLYEEARMQLGGLGRGVSNASERMAHTDKSVGATFHA
ncbi:WXG100 family type VII secretion target [Gordonia insulae]|uniref:ESAT-6-like protein EsxA n=1 Tax=Gordonia insulae TaxID=2420509 RepID=A0A3G8JV65_9ACTN|nr:WXG100 family type VII secretion target [Gordonia insulae]AZG48442.1 ESAT-6-like protein EsxA [Gordonia insulae]